MTILHGWSWRPKIMNRVERSPINRSFMHFKSQILHVNSINCVIELRRSTLTKRLTLLVGSLAMSTKRVSADGNCEDVSAKRGKISLADSVDVNAVMSSEGPVVSTVILRANGESEEHVIDMSPKLQLVAKILGSSVGFLGQWETLEVVLIMRVDQDNEKIPMNVHTLQPPFHEAEVRGDILLMRNNDEGIPVDFTLKEYQEFQQLVIEKWEPGEALSDEGMSKLN